MSPLKMRLRLNFLASAFCFDYSAPVFSKRGHDSNIMSQYNKEAERKEREEKRAAALRENLKRRRQQKQERESHDGPRSNKSEDENERRN